MYYVYLDKILLPISPEKIQQKIKGKNKTMSLINEGEVNQIKLASLTEINFECLLPQITNYPFAVYDDGKFKKANVFLEKFEKLKNSKKPFKLKILRTTQNFKPLFDTNILVTLEEYTIVEDVKDGFDVKVSINLKQYRNYGPKELVIKKKKNGKKIVRVGNAKKRLNKVPARVYKVKSGDCLWNIAKKELNNGSRWKSIYTINKDIIESTARKHSKRSSSSGHWIYAGTLLKLGDD